ncbi:dihydrolipoamide acetyltransferase family protein [Brucella rhizosphaerae]|uniref:Dihydrolipoamide acetyltransferase component of pyruvate dehydrogenase complex n=1 Tax=Brucella rhizosphaerae TaxID=571254 RepID=A0A256FSD6_9HYPH|nr:dihydrolipoamide acetyltransferase family protein [Brucella rhizosphaerae]OYR17775.1 biotin-requiring enzyme family protein [Brucella rhizosphaerae]
MPHEIKLPSLSAGMESGTLARWLKRDGDAVEKQEVIAEIEIDKATMELEAPVSGILGGVTFLDREENVPVGSTLGILFANKDDYANFNLRSTSIAIPTDAKQTARGESINREFNSNPVAQQENITEQELRTKASPLARRLARANGLDFDGLEGSGPRGRIVRIDIERELKKKQVVTPASTISKFDAINAISFAIDGERIPHSPMRKAIARRLSQSKATIPHFYLRTECVVDDILELRTRINASGIAEKISINDFMIKAFAYALAQTPQANIVWNDDAMIALTQVDIAVAVATDGGLITPIVRNADRKSLSAISSEVRSLAMKARSGKLSPSEFEGGSASISNLGMYGVSEFSAIINPPQSMILAVGAVERRVVCKSDELVAANCVTCVLSVDHRAIDGALAGDFFKVFKSALEQPLTLLV